MTEEYVKDVSVIGAGGKMGRGIALLLLQEMIKTEAEKTGTIGKGPYCLNLVDTYEPSLSGLQQYLRFQLAKYADRNRSKIKENYTPPPHVHQDEDFIDAFVEDSMAIIRCGTDLQMAKESTLIFEAILEEVEAKTALFRSLNDICCNNPYYMTNTSSIPISLLDEKADLNHRIIGFHFYNPPPVQKLVEVISPANVDPSVEALASDLGQRLKKKLVPSRDVAGFIGNGHLIREVFFACENVATLSEEHSMQEAVYMVNRVTQEFLIRPMGIFQLLDYVGIDVGNRICHIMSEYIPGSHFHHHLLETMKEVGIVGGQRSDASQKDGFFSYDKNRIVGIFNCKSGNYEPLSNSTRVKSCDRKIGALPGSHASWKDLVKSPEKEEQLREYFSELSLTDTFGSQLAKTFLQKSREIAETLVHDGVAHNIEDVNTILTNGFGHLYGANATFLEVLTV